MTRKEKKRGNRAVETLSALEGTGGTAGMPCSTNFLNARGASREDTAGSEGGKKGVRRSRAGVWGKKKPKRECSTREEKVQR